MRTLAFCVMLLLAFGAAATAEPHKLGPVEFHVLPEFGFGVLLRDSNVVSISDRFYMFRIPGLQMPGWNSTTTGLQVELSPLPGAGTRYDIISFTRTKVAGPVYTGANIRFMYGTSELGTVIHGRIMPVAGVHMLTAWEAAKVSLEFELLDNNRPFKALLVLGWE